MRRRATQTRRTSATGTRKRIILRQLYLTSYLFSFARKVPKVPETLLKKRKLNAELRAKRARANILQKKKQQGKRHQIFKRAEKYVREYKKQEQDQVRLKRIARHAGNFYVPAEPSLAFVVRIRG